MRTQPFDPFAELRAAPAIIVGNRDLQHLRALVERHARGPASELADQLDQELQRAIVVPQAHVPPEVIGLGSRVALEEAETGLRREVVLALPEDAGAAPDRLALLSPLAVALLGAAAGETVEYVDARGEVVDVRILAVTPAGGA